MKITIASYKPKVMNTYAKLAERVTTAYEYQRPRKIHTSPYIIYKQNISIAKATATIKKEADSHYDFSRHKSKIQIRPKGFPSIMNGF